MWHELGYGSIYGSVLFSISTNKGIYFHDPEITPAGCQGSFRFDVRGKKVDSFSPEVEVRAVIEGQFLAKLTHARSLGYQISSSSRVLATGGASKNTEILQVHPPRLSLFFFCGE